MTGRLAANKKKIFVCFTCIKLVLMIMFLTASPVFADVTSGSSVGEYQAETVIEEPDTDQADTDTVTEVQSQTSVSVDTKVTDVFSITNITNMISEYHTIVIVVPAALIMALIILILICSPKKKNGKPDVNVTFNVYDQYMKKLKMYYDLCSAELLAIDRTREKMAVFSARYNFNSIENLRNEVMSVGELIPEARMRADVIRQNENENSSRRELEVLCDDLEQAVDTLVSDFEKIKEEHTMMRAAVGR